MEIFNSLMGGFATCISPYNILMAFTGCLLGTIIGILPGLGPSATMAILIPITFGMNATPAMIMMCAVYYGAMYGGSTTSILVNVPGESSSVITAIEGHQLAKKGKAGTALGLSAIGSFIAGILGTIGLVAAAVPLADFSLKFGPAEFFSLILMGMLTIVFVGGKSIPKSLMSAAIGLGLGCIGTDIVQGKDRFTYGIAELLDGIDFVVLVMGTFGIGEVLVSAEEFMKVEPIKVKFRELFPSLKEILICRWAILRGTIIGFIIGVLPGAGPTIASFVTYGVEKSVHKHPEKFGTGVLEGIAGPESSNNAATSGAMVPMFALGIPGSGATAVMLGALILYGLKPGPMLFVQNADFVWAVMASMFIGNIILIIMNLPLVPLFASLLRISYGLIYPAILIICVIGAYAISTGLFDVGLMLIFGVAGYFMKKADIPPAPMLLSLLLGPMMERALYQALNLSYGSMMTFVTRPISATLLAISALMAIAVGFKAVRKARKIVGDEDKA
jgi:putative tricarboxylic transport membrane protein